MFDGGVMFENELRDITENIMRASYLSAPQYSKTIPHSAHEMMLSLGSAMSAYARMFNVVMTVHYIDLEQKILFQFDDLTEPKHLIVSLYVRDAERFTAARSLRSTYFDYFRFEFDKRFLK